MIIIHTIDSEGIYGAEQVLLNLMSAQKTSGHRVLLFSLRLPNEHSRPVDLAARNLGVNVISFSCPSGPDFSIINALFELIRTHRADICHSHGYRTNILLGLARNRPRICRYLTTNHGWTAKSVLSKLWLYKCADILCQNRLDAIVFVNRFITQQGLLHCLNWKKVHFIENGIKAPTEENTLNPGAAEKIRQFTSRFTKTLACVGRLSKEKNQLLLLQALQALQADPERPGVILIGDGPEMQRLKNFCQQKGLTDQVMFTGYLDQASHYLSLVDALVISSITEGLPMVLLEAMSRNIPVISSSVGAIPGIIESTVSGYLFPSGDINALCYAIQQYCNNQDIEKMLDAAFHTYKNRYSSDIMAQQYQNLYEALLEST